MGLLLGFSEGGKLEEELEPCYQFRDTSIFCDITCEYKFTNMQAKTNMMPCICLLINLERVDLQNRQKESFNIVGWFWPALYFPSLVPGAEGRVLCPYVSLGTSWW